MKLVLISFIIRTQKQYTLDVQQDVRKCTHTKEDIGQYALHKEREGEGQYIPDKGCMHVIHAYPAKVLL